MGAIISAIILVPVAIVGVVAHVVIKSIGFIVRVITKLLCLPFVLGYFMCFADDDEGLGRRSRLSPDITEKPGDASGRSLAIRIAAIPSWIEWPAGTGRQA
ncbi:hypothetical protein L226DRAFT_533899 [Lentinus tigrinus ALCF2SS1-7]|uniref:Uncharacterized protein n=1 Tax=Lentinus tigrinus ALCF2SS1-6 TaxID=1328759 RepID=A0A5C2S9S9_9APHY|nr:hypothetical protein L227DRAFT_653270 [Lentinus tigrinus ALCF2SS1-6]RPD75825.1 hypothetical protein L226DRAFT_533899 [Lentinus tigrinus ALCF2SS1-7]